MWKGKRRFRGLAAGWLEQLQELPVAAGLLGDSIEEVKRLRHEIGRLRAKTKQVEDCLIRSRKRRRQEEEEDEDEDEDSDDY